MSYPHEEYKMNNVRKFAITTLGARIVAMVSLIVAVAVFQTNDADIDNKDVHVTYNDFRSYKYSFWVSLIGVGYTVLQVPFAIHYMLRKKHLINTYAFLIFDFYADKMVAFILATAVGTAFGATTELKNGKWENISQDGMEEFLTVEYISAACILVGSIACGISSIHSSLALTQY